MDINTSQPNNKMGNCSSTQSICININTSVLNRLRKERNTILDMIDAMEPNHAHNFGDQNPKKQKPKLTQPPQPSPSIQDATQDRYFLSLL